MNAAGRLCATLALAGCFSAATVGAALAQLPANPLPISLEARSSDFDRRNERLVFHDVSITQGDLAISADLAEATRLDFENSQWVFTGHVNIEFEAATISSDAATLRFEGHQLRHAEIVGSPAEFAQKELEDGVRATGQASRLEYDFDSGIVTLSQNARLSEGANNITGDWLRYDMRAERIVAGSEDEGDRVQITITPPAEDAVEEAGPEQ
ncbi:MAG: lipopolysaccharide transport periplasmic protein LptA [Gammaproteobacteria bacterium]